MSPELAGFSRCLVFKIIQIPLVAVLNAKLLRQRREWLVWDIENVGDRHVYRPTCEHIQAAFTQLPEGMHEEQADDRCQDLTYVCANLPLLECSILSE
jgi:hypothetical protein